MPALQPYIIEPIWKQFSALLPERKTNHPLGCHRRRIPDRVVFEKLVQVKPWGLREMWVGDLDGVRLVIVEVPEDHPLR